MKTSFVVLSIFLLIFQFKAFCQDTINWRATYKLTSQDFRARPDESSEAGALSDCTISYGFVYKDDSLAFKFQSFFTRSKSWLKFRNDTVLLNHEQGHFDINELFARKLKQAFKAYSFNKATVTKDLEMIFDKIWEEEKAYNALYDAETEHSKNRTKQMEWNKTIADELDKLSEFK